ncbi:MAG: type II toxin-antitoxin system YafQ family toxin [Candidatus Amulumruptor caecigallinarius]|nr:type II toxin-antitoxin system YafQ family toxin [Candidatus Amulumruptor caecigallinarius]MCM1396651.1 type II toxin-antitoxin system YafQ family toxin [Candidatus Amulumruptor caecigallinarius]MCM1453291.1 type II toxin-antitoxin system YafQ family toxin [bacterium]
MFELEVTRQYLRDLKLARKRGLDESKLDDIIGLLLRGEPLPRKNKDHALKNDYKGCRECHITPDWLLVYSVDNGLRLITLVRTGSHSDLF